MTIGVGHSPRAMPVVAPDDRKSLYQSVYERMRELILATEGGIAALPSTRRLAEELNVSRNTVVAAYQLLAADGLISTTKGGRTRINPLAFERRQHLAGRTRRSGGAEDPRGGRHAARRPFAVGVPALDRFPTSGWARAAAGAARAMRPPLLGYQDPYGSLRLRRLLSDNLLARRGLRCDPERIMVVPGFQAGLNLVARLLLQPGDEVRVEDPGHLPTRAGLQALGLTAEPLPVDGDGARADLLATFSSARLVVLTPARQFPLGVPLAAERRRAAIAWAHRSNGWIVEDDYDTEFHFVGAPPDALAALDAGADARTIHIGTFSKTLFPSLRIGFVVVPPALVEPLGRLRRTVDGHQSSLDQEVLAGFMKTGAYDRHLAAMRALYRQRQATLASALPDLFGTPLRMLPSTGGTHLSALFERPGVRDDDHADRLRAAGVHVAPLSRYRMTPGPAGLVLGFSDCTEADLARTRTLVRSADLWNSPKEE